MVDPLPGESGKRGEVLVTREPLGLEPPHLAGRGRSCSTALPPTIQRIAGSHPSRSASLTSSYPASRPNTDWRSMPTRSWRTFRPVRVSTRWLARDGHQAKRGIEFAISQQACIGGDTRTVELQLEAMVEIEPESIGFGFTPWPRQHCLDPMRYDVESYSSNGIGAGLFNRSSGQCGLRHVSQANGPS